MKFENKKSPLLSKSKFFKRQFRYFIYSSVIIILSLGIGTLGYSYFGNISLVDGFYNASLILTGMGPVDPMITNSAKLFASFYALYSGVAFLSTAAILFAPTAHRFLHYLQIEEDS
jgi:xanthine/uracil permease